jgi:hypothetical protein
MVLYSSDPRWVSEGTFVFLGGVLIASVSVLVFVLLLLPSVREHYGIFSSSS